MKIKILLVFVSLLLNALWLGAQDSPLWQDLPVDLSINTAANSGALGGLSPSVPQLIAPDPIVSGFSLTVPQSVDAEIQELAQALDDDPVRIFNYVRNNIDYQHYFGLRKGAKLTFLEGSGNDFDQCALLAELLNAAGYSNTRYRFASQLLYWDDIQDWVGFAPEPFPGQTFLQSSGSTIIQAFSNGTDHGVGDVVAKQAIFSRNAYINRGFTLAGNSILNYTTSFPSQASIVVDRLWLQLNIAGTIYNFDPSYKKYEEIDGLDDLLNNIGYSRTQLLSDAGGSTGTGYVKSLNDANVASYLTGLSQSLLTYFDTNYPGVSLEEVISGRRIIRRDIASLTEGFELPFLFFGLSNEAWTSIDNIPDTYKTKVRFKSGSIDQTLYTESLSGKKVSLSFSGTTVQLRLDDGAPIDTTTVTANTFNLETTITHPGSLDPSSETKEYKRNDNFSYAIIYGFTPSGRLLQKRYDLLNQYLTDGMADDSFEVRSELLNVMGLTWLYQTELVDRLLANQNDVSSLVHHRFGRVGQEEGFYIDVGLQSGSRLVRDGISDDGRRDNVFHLGSLYISALEHGVIEQMQPGTSAVSTVNILRQANEDGQQLYLANSGNWSTVKNQLSGYSTAQKNDFQDLVNNTGASLFLPKKFSVNAKLADGSASNWTGSGWVIRSDSEAGMIIAGGYSGGYSFWNPSSGNNYVSSPSISTSSFYNPTYVYSAPSLPSHQSLPSLPSLPRSYGSDPVDMATGAFIYASVDLETGTGAAPRGLSFSRHYSSNLSSRDHQNLGYGWTHPLYIRAVERTASEETLALTTPQHSAALLVSALVGSDLYRANASAKEWGVTALAVGWFVDQMTDSAVSITIGPDAFQFIKLPDGSYEPPTGSTMELTEVNGDFRLKQRLGNTLYFEDTEDSENDAQRIQKIVDVDGHEMSFEYHNDDRINYIEDDFGRKYTFGYNGDDHITSITDSTDNRSIGFRYDAEDNLDRATDPEGKHSYYIYEAATDSDGATPVDPSATAASEHRIVRMRNHDKEIITQNVWDNLGRVKEQYLHGDTSKSWKLRYSGVENYEEDPEGGITTYLYDERGRSIGKIDAEGRKSIMKYDGQDQVVERVSGTGEITILKYDSDHNLLQIDYPRGGGSTINVYDSLHRLDYTTDPESNLTDFVYFDSGFNAGKNRLQQLIDPEGTTTFTYYESGTAAGMVKTITDDDNLVTENGYDAYGQPDWTDAPGDFRTDFQYTARGDLDYVEDPNGVRTDFTYNDRRQATKIVTDQNGVDEATEDRTYDNQGRLQSVEAPQDNSGLRVKQNYTYTPTDNLDVESLVNETATTADDAVVDYDYDGRDWGDSVTDAANREIEVLYFANGEVDKVQRPASRTSSFVYDDDNRVLTQTNPGAPTNRVHGFSYGETLSADGDMTEGYPRSIFTDADSLTTTTEFNRLGQTRYYRNKSDNIFEARYDGLGRSTHNITPLDAANSRATLTTYYHRGEVDTITEPSGETATFGYDGTTGRLASATYSDGVTSEVVNYTLYDDNGNLKTLNEGTDAISRTYDNLNRVKSYTDIDGNTIGYRYYDSGKVAKIIYPGGTENGVGHVEYTYWKTGRLKEVIDKLDSTTSPRTTTNYWNDDGRLDRIVRPNGTVRNIKYDTAGRPEIVEEYTSAGQLLALHKNKYFESDELQWVYQLPKPQTVGAKPNAVSAMLYNVDNQLSSFEGQLVTHDADGNMTNGPLPDGSFGIYDFDIRNRLESAGGVSYGYDPEGERVSLSATGEAVSYVNENNLGLTKVLQRTKNGEVVRYVWGVGLLYEVNDSAEATYYHFDNYGSTIALTDESEMVTDRVEYSPFGSITHREGTHDTPFLFTGFFGNQTDSNGLIHMRARFYNPLIRRFVNADPAQQGWNWYAYAAGNPLGFVDPTGLGNQGVLDAVQTGLSFLGMTPVVGFVADIANAGISLARGNYAGAALDFAAAIPGIGQAAGAAKLAGVGFGVFGAIRTADRVGDLVRGSNRAQRLLLPPIDITKSGLQHVIDRHTVNGIKKFAAKSKFNQGEDIGQLIRNGTQQPMVLQANGRFARTFNTGRDIGLDRTTGNQTSIMTIITNRNSSLVTAFPGKP